jgi:pimeloyl-ACP methyl ester carboxylesterase
MRLLSALLGAIVAVACAAQTRAASPSVQAEMPPARAGSSLEGIWVGALEVNAGLKLRLAFHITRGSDGALSATLDSIDQGAKGIPVDSVVEQGGKVRIELKRIGAAFEGTLDPAKTRIDGAWSQGGASLPLVLTRSETAPVVNRPQEPRRPFPYTEEAVTFENAAQGVTLAGTFTAPREGGPFPAVILVSGSGPQDRDESLVGHKPFLVLSDYLTRRGFAVLRYDDRGTGKSTGKYSFDQTAEDYGTDAAAGVAYLKSRKDVDPRRIGVVGHSEGALVAPILAANDPSIAFIVLMAGPGTPGDQLLAAQSALISRAMGAEEGYEELREGAAKMIAIVRAEKDDAAAERKIRELRDEELAKMSEARRKEALARADQYEQAVKVMLTPYIRHFLAFDPRPWLTRVKCPVLALTGELDLQVPAGENLISIASALEAGGNRDYAVVKLPGLNHLFQTAKVGAPSEYGEIEETFSPVALATIANWLEPRARPSR